VIALIELIGTTLRLMGSVLLIGFLPGLALSWWLFAKPSLEMVERIFISILLSLVVSAMAAYGLVIVGLGVSPAGMVIVILILSMLFVAGGYLRRRKMQPPFENARTRYLQIIEIVKDNPLQSGLIVAFTVMVALGLTFTLYLENQPPALSITEFYIDPDHLNINGVQIESAENMLEIPVVLVNRAGKLMKYRIESQVHGSTPETINMNVSYFTPDQIGGIYLGPGETWRGTLRIPINDTQVDYIELNLFDEGAVSPRANLRVWLAE
jgi:uncharacterized membrane protein